MLVAEAPQSGNIGRWIYNIFSDMRTNNAAQLQASTIDGGVRAAAGNASSATVPVISGSLSSQSQLSNTAVATPLVQQGSNFAYVTASYGVMQLQIEVAFPPPSAQAPVVFSHQAAGAYQSTSTTTNANVDAVTFNSQG